MNIKETGVVRFSDSEVGGLRRRHERLSGVKIDAKVDSGLVARALGELTAESTRKGSTPLREALKEANNNAFFEPMVAAIFNAGSARAVQSAAVASIVDTRELDLTAIARPLAKYLIDDFGWWSDLSELAFTILYPQAAARAGLNKRT